MTATPTLSIIGGTGALGGGLAKRWFAAGYRVILGSRSAERAAEEARKLGAATRGMANRAAAEAGDIVVLAIPYGGREAILDDIKPGVLGKIVLDTTAPLVPPKVSVVQLPPEGSAA